MMVASRGLELGIRKLGFERGFRPSKIILLIEEEERERRKMGVIYIGGD